MYFKHFPHLFDASSFRHGMHLIEHLIEIQAGGKIGMTCTGG